MNNEVVENTKNQNSATSQKIIKTDIGNKDGQNKCPYCSATEIKLNEKTGKLRCLYCRSEFENKIIEGLEQDISKLEGEIVGSGSTNIIADVNEVITFKCSSCGAEVVIDTNESTQARCHWCRNTLSINQQIPNGAIPDTVLPFKLTKQIAEGNIKNFVKKRSFFAHPIFKKEFTTDNIMGVYLPYMLVDINGHATLKGQGEIETRRYTVGSGEDAKTYYDADLYNVERDFDITIDDLTVESSKDKLDHTAKDKTTNIINAVMPFDTENCVKYDSNYIKGYTSEKRDVNLDDLRDYINVQAKDIARFQANATITQYDRGVRWDYEDLNIKGQQWMSAYLPIWLYSYQQVKKDKKVLHYVAVNARTGETMGSVPINYGKLIFISSIVEIIGLMAMIFVDWDYSYLFALLGVIFFFIFYSKYRNKKARHLHEKETKSNIENVTNKNDFVESRKRLRSAFMDGANNNSVSNAKKDILNNIVNINIKK